MTYLDFYKKLNSMKDKEYMENFLVYNSSLVLAGAKPSVTITIKKNNYNLYNNWNTFGDYFIKKLKLNYIQLREYEDAIVIMVYDEFILEKHLNSDCNKKFLINLGYSDNSTITDYVSTLKSRYEEYHCPHELGIFLGIPIKDVKDFMECTTKKCLLCKYWKVYNDSYTAQLTFNKYDQIKEYTMKTMLKGNLSVNLALNIKNSFKEII